jgi:hypothetical protein
VGDQEYDSHAQGVSARSSFQSIPQRALLFQQRRLSQRRDVLAVVHGWERIVDMGAELSLWPPPLSPPPAPHRHTHEQCTRAWGSCAKKKSLVPAMRSACVGSCWRSAGTATESFRNLIVCPLYPQCVPPLPYLHPRRGTYARTRARTGMHKIAVSNPPCTHACLRTQRKGATQCTLATVRPVSDCPSDPHDDDANNNSTKRPKPTLRCGDLQEPDVGPASGRGGVTRECLAQVLSVAAAAHSGSDAVANGQHPRRRQPRTPTPSTATVAG